MTENCPARRDPDFGSIRPVSAVNRARKFILYIVFGLLLASCIGGGVEVPQSFFDPRPPAEWVFMSGKVVTVDSSSSIKEAVAIKNGRFVAVGTDSEIRRWIGRSTAVVNLAGRTMIPGLIDSHIHATVAGLSWDGELHWESLRSLAEGLKQIEAAARNKPAGTWIVVGGGWAPGQFAEKRLPTRAELDDVAPKHPVYIQYLRQAAVLNSAGLAAAGIDGKAADPQGGKFERNPSSGELRVDGCAPRRAGVGSCLCQNPTSDLGTDTAESAQLLSGIESLGPNVRGRFADRRRNVCTPAVTWGHGQSRRT